MIKKFIICLLAFAFLSFTNHLNNNKVKGYPTQNMNKEVMACQDFYQYAIGGWMKNNPMPATESRWGAFNILQKENDKKLEKILTDILNSEEKYKKGSDQQLLKDFYLSSLDSAENEKLGSQPILKEWKFVDGFKDKSKIGEFLAQLKIRGNHQLFGFYVGADAKNSTQNAVYLSQGGLTLPDVDFYTKDDEKSKNIREEFVKHIDNLFALAKISETGMGSKILSMETDLANISMTRTERRDPDKTYNKMNMKDLNEKFSSINWNNYFKIATYGKKIDEVIVGQPKFFTDLSNVINKYSVNDWKTYFKWHILSGRSGLLSQEFVKENFRFFATVLRGTTTMKSHKEKAINLVNSYLGETLGKEFVKHHFSKESKEKVALMVEELREVFRGRIKNLDWMSDSTKEKALTKLNAFKYKIGYTEKWKDYSKAKVKPKTLVENIVSIGNINYLIMINKIGKEVDKSEWSMTPQTVNAYYSSSYNEIVFPAGILQYPFFDPESDDALNYGGIGAVIGHEFSHGFDDKGSKYDHLGNLNNWWSKEDRNKFEQRTQKIIDQFNRFEVLEGVFINGSLTQGENIADLAGLTLAYHALNNHYKTHKPNGTELDGFTWQQRFFLGWSLVWAQNISEKELRNRIITDPHSPGMYRVLGPLANIEEFWQAFECQDNQAMKAKPENIVKIW